MHFKLRGVTATAAVLALSAALTAPAVAGPTRSDGPHRDQRSFTHVGTFDVRDNGTGVAEIVAATRDGKTLAYTDSQAGLLGFVDISDPATPVGDGVLPVAGEPTSVAVDNRHVLVAVDTSTSFTDPSGQLLVIDLVSRTTVATHQLPGQPDSVAVSPDGRYAAVVLENERDEEHESGLIPQPPSGSLLVLETTGAPSTWTMTEVTLAGLPDRAPSDAEPEYVDINQQNQAVVSLQENNHLVIVDLPSARVVADFPAGEVALAGVDATEEAIGPQDRGLIRLDETVARRREPDAVAWLDQDTFATSNEGDYEDPQGNEGGSRGWTLFNVDGTVEHEAGTSFEYAGVSAGHYNEGRSADKGSEPEAVEVGRYGGRTLLFVGSERANFVQVLDVTTGNPESLQLLPTGIGPEGVLAIENRRLLTVSSETAEGSIPSMITLYAQDRGAAAYPQLSSTDIGGVPIPWVAQSGLAADLQAPDTLWSVSDSVLAHGFVHEIRLDEGRGVIVDRHRVEGASFSLDLEGIADAPEGGFWLASEGRVGERPNALVKVDDGFAVTAEVFLPAELAVGATSSGFEGLAVEPTADGTDTRFVYAVVQREWATDADRHVKIARYEVGTGEWTFASYQKDPVESPAGGWIGLSELTRLPEGTFAIVERDNQSGPDARTKKIYGVDLADAEFRAFGENLDVIDKTLLADVMDDLDRSSVWTPDKLEGLGVTVDGEAYIVTDNDGLDGALGQTVFLRLGNLAEQLGD